jgi:cell fate (sporulation/competence/biofilm development) regulator YlbF (YheA/YmcA/DUF963 family)
MFMFSGTQPHPIEFFPNKFQTKLLNDSPLHTQIDEHLANNVQFCEEILGILSKTSSGPSSSLFTSDGDNSNLEFLLSIGVLNLNPEPENLNAFIKIDDNANFIQSTNAKQYQKYVTQYKNKLQQLQGLKLKLNEAPQSSFQTNLHQQLNKILNEIKYYIFDVYFNNHLQFVYLLFAFNIISMSEINWKGTSQHSQHGILVKKAKEIVDEFEVKTTEEHNKKLSDIRKKQEEIMTKIRSSPQFGGSTTAVVSDATAEIDRLIEKRNHFKEVYTKTRDSLKTYFDDINDIIFNLLNQLVELREHIADIEPSEYSALTTLNLDLNAVAADDEAQQQAIQEEQGKTLQGLQDQVQNKIDAIKQRVSAVTTEPVGHLGGFIRGKGK